LRSRHASRGWYVPILSTIKSSGADGELRRKAAIVFFLYRHFTLLNAAEMSDEKDAIENEKKALTKKLSEAKKAGADKNIMQAIQIELSRL
jgi:hypothetical protein